MTRLRRAALALAALAVLAGLAACGGDDDTDQAAAGTGTESGDSGDSPDGDDVAELDVDLCSVLTAADLEAIFEVPFAEGATTVPVQCEWVSQDGGASVNVVRGGGFDATVQALEDTDTEFSEIDGVGDGAYLFVSGVSAQLGVDVGGDAYIFSYGSADLDAGTVEERLVAVAETALEHL